jgi:two-component system, chemotaxis family, sensor kinase Cph1
VSTTDQPTAWTDQPYSIKRHGTTITNCDTEPVQTPGCIQAHGAMLVLRASDFSILQVSENSLRWFAASPEELLGTPAAAALGADACDRLRGVLDCERTETGPRYVFTRPGSETAPPCDVSVHLTNGVVVVELEPVSLGVSAGGDGPPGAIEPDYYAMLRASVARLQYADSLRAFNQVVADQVRTMTGLDRVMIYRFHEDGHGEVVAESRQASVAPWLGLHYPAEDIPRPAREVFQQIWLRPVPDVAGELAELVPLVNPDTGLPLTMTHCILRGPSVMYTEYLQNMGVKAAMTMPIRRGGQLWGLIACHHYATPAFLPFAVRAACEFFAQVVSIQHRAAEEREHSEYQLRLAEIQRQLISAAAESGDLASLTAGQPSLLDAMDATGAAVFHSDRWWTVGRTPSDAQLDRLATWLRTQPSLAAAVQPHVATDSVTRALPDAADHAAVASGVLAVPISRDHTNLVMWFRPEQVQTVHWGGNPLDTPTVPGPHGPRLTPRRSFELYVESVRQRALPWNTVEIAAAGHLRTMVLELVVARAERLGAVNLELSRSNEELDSFAFIASHDLKEPLRGIHKYAHQLLEELKDAGEPQRAKLAAMLRLTERMDALLDSLLHHSRVGRAVLRTERVALDELLDEAIEVVEPRRTERPTTIIRARPLPAVACDPIRIREVFINLLSNAIKYNDQPECRIEVGHLSPGEPGDRGNPPKLASKRIVLFVRDNGIGIAAQHHDQVFRMFKRLHGRDAYGGGSGAGLAIVKRLVERHGGQVWLASAPGHGTCVYFELGEEQGIEPP